MTTFIKKLENEISLWESRMNIENSPLGGNVVKAAQYGGTVAGLKIALIIFEGLKEDANRHTI